jgi:hypothetical protein
MTAIPDSRCSRRGHRFFRWYQSISGTTSRSTRARSSAMRPSTTARRSSIADPLLPGMIVSVRPRTTV